mmetsp:Transcript_52739/g.171528  ORF Transcript_52739/g.171528 Transcript_52739/m.171528 type:complete len:265 (-) Transcript_52739:220-1014(-)
MPESTSSAMPPPRPPVEPHAKARRTSKHGGQRGAVGVDVPLETLEVRAAVVAVPRPLVHATAESDVVLALVPGLLALHRQPRAEDLRLRVQVPVEGLLGQRLCRSVKVHLEAVVRGRPPLLGRVDVDAQRAVAGASQRERRLDGLEVRGLGLGSQGHAAATVHGAHRHRRQILAADLAEPLRRSPFGAEGLRAKRAVRRRPGLRAARRGRREGAVRGGRAARCSAQTPRRRAQGPRRRRRPELQRAGAPRSAQRRRRGPGGGPS